MKKKIATILTVAVIGATAFTFCASAVAASEINSIKTTETGTLYTFTDGTGYYTEEIEGINTLDNLYPLTGIVTEINYSVEPEIDEVTITCANGNKFSWYADSSDCWEINDLASCIMDSKETAIVYDDEVLLAHYAGGLKHFEQYKN